MVQDAKTAPGDGRREGPHSYPVRVYYEDTDASGVAYHANYLRWFERARTEWLRDRGFGQERLRLDTAAAFAVSSIKVEYRKPARLDDELLVLTWVLQFRRASVLFEQVLERSGELVIASANVHVACVDAVSFRPKALPSGLI